MFVMWQQLSESLMNSFLIHTHFLTMISISLFYCCKKFFAHMNIWMIGKDSVKLVLSEKEDFYSHLNMKDITDADYIQGRVYVSFRIRNLEDYHDLYVQSDTLLLADVFENFWNMCLEICELDPAHFLSAPGLPWQVA